MESIAFKEWAIVCEALGGGIQSILLRKGGIAEGREGFSFRHFEFFLFPTFFHEQIGKIRLRDIDLPEQREDKVELRFLARVEIAKWIASAATLELLEPLHVLTPEVIRERFEYDSAAGVHVAFLRVFRLQPTWTLDDSPSFGGCRSWVNLPAPPPDLSVHPVLTDERHQALRKQFLDSTKAAEPQTVTTNLQLRRGI